MASQVGKKVSAELSKLKENVENSYQYFKPNYERYHTMRRFVFRSTLTDDEKSKLEELNRPPLEFNVLEAYISRLRGEFSKQEPSFCVRPAPDVGTVDPILVETIEGYLLSRLEESKSDSFEYKIYTDQLSGGFSVMKVWTEYENERTFNQSIKLGRVYDPTLCGFDPLARDPHKGDGEYCYEIFPIDREEFVRLYPNVDLSGLTNSKSLAGFDWYYKAGKKDILLFCNYYKKKKKKRKVVYIAPMGNIPAQSMFEEEYEDLVRQFEDARAVAQAPVITATRMSEITTICRYQFIENQIIKYEETDYKFLPLIFVDGNSIYLRESNEGSSTIQFTRPYIYNAVDTQRLKNVAGQTMANEIELMVTHKFKVPKEAIPEQYQEAYNNVQRASTLVYNAFDSNGTPIPPPEEVQRVPIPPEIPNTFAMADQTIQAILGSYDAALGINDNQLAGVAIVEAATQSNAAAMPYIVNFLAALNQAANIIIDLIPKYLNNPRMIPVIDSQKKATFRAINGFPATDGSKPIDMKYSPSTFNVTVTPGVNFEIQKNRSVQMLTMLGKTFPAVNQLINTQGLAILFDNLDFRGAEQLKGMAEDMMEQQQQQQQQGPPPNPAIMRLNLDQQKLQMDTQTKQQSLLLEAQQIKNDMMKMMMQYESDRNQDLVQLQKARTETAVHAATLDLQHKKQMHDQAMDAMDQTNKLIDSIGAVQQQQQQQPQQQQEQQNQ